MFDSLFGRGSSGGHFESPVTSDQRQNAFAFTANVTHGFPTQPATFDYDEQLRLAAIGTKNGCIRCFGAPGVELAAAIVDENDDVAILRLMWINGQGQLAVLLDNWSVELFKIEKTKNGENALVNYAKYTPQIRVEITAWAVHGNKLICGTDTADLVSISLDKAEFNECVNHADVIDQLKPLIEYDKALGTVETIATHEDHPDELLIGYQRGICIRYNLPKNQIISAFKSAVSLEALDWVDDERVIMSFGDGSMCVWDCSLIRDNTDETDVRIGTVAGLGQQHTIVYGPEPCKPVTKLRQRSDLIVFQGGLPRASHGDRFAISAWSSQSHVAFDFSSKIVDFVITRNLDLLVLCEEEFVAIDLETAKWPQYKLPYLSPIHSSALTAVNCVQVKSDIVTKIANLTDQSTSHSPRPWPISGGRPVTPKATNQKGDNHESVLLTGHEDGSVRLWRLGAASMLEIGKVTTMQYFNTDDEPFPEDQEEINEWPPFRKVGLYDPYSDDPRLGIRRLDMCPKTGALLVGGTAGQVLVFIVAEQSGDHLVPERTIDLFEAQKDEIREKFKWKGHQRLTVKDERHFEAAGYQVQCIMQASPPAAITAMALEASWNLVCLGTSHGFALFDYRRLEPVQGMVRCTLETTDNSQEASSGFVRGKSFRKSLRQTMHRIRSSFRSRNRSQRGRAGSGRRPKGLASNGNKLDEANRKLNEENLGHKEVRIERRLPTVETAGEGAIVKTMTFAVTNVKDGLGIAPTVWVGTAGGCVYFYALQVPDYNRREEAKVTPISAKTLQMQHRAPVLGIDIIDVENGPVTSQHQPKSHSHHQLVITTEEQIKVYSLPKVTFKKKFKLAALEGSLIRKSQFARFTTTTTNAQTTNQSAFYCLATLTNQGEVILFNLDCGKIVITDHRFENVIEKENLNGIFYSCLTNDGQGLYLLSQSEFQRFSTNQFKAAKTPCRISAL